MKKLSTALVFSLAFIHVSYGQQIRSLPQVYSLKKNAQSYSGFKNSEGKSLPRAKIDSDTLAEYLNYYNPGIVFSGIGGINNLGNFSGNGGSVSIGANFRIKDYSVKGNNKLWVKSQYLYLYFNTRSNSSVDSNNIAKTFLFPEISKRDFIIGYTRSYTHLNSDNIMDWSIDPTLEFSLNNYSVDSIAKHFFSESILVGANFSKTWNVNIGIDSSIAVGFQLFPYFNYINVQKKFAPDYHAILGENMIKNNISAIGIQCVLRIAQIAMSANLKWVLNSGKNIQNSDLKGLNYSIGIAINSDLLKFRTQ